MVETPLLDIGLLHMKEICTNLSDEGYESAKETLAQYLSGRLDFATVCLFFKTKFDDTKPIDRVKEILDVPDEPIPPYQDLTKCGLRKRTQSWTAIEDNRLLAAIHRFGIDNWNTVAHFVGNNRTRSQCSQRWQRGLDPRISKSQWTKEEEVELLRLVALHGEKSWIRVSTAMATRSDVQCRYRYHQIQKEKVITEADPKPDVKPVADAQPSKELAHEPSLEEMFAFNPRVNLESSRELFWPFG
jgi:hypothetical protein